MRLRTFCLLEFDLPESTPFLFMLRLRSGWNQWVVREEFIMTPTVQAHEFCDPFGNFCQRVIAPQGLFSIRASAEIDLSGSTDMGYGAPYVPIGELPEVHIPFLYPSRFVESDKFNQIASDIVEGAKLGYDQCARIVSHIRNTLQYLPGEGVIGSSAWEVNAGTSGVCRDMAHLGIALCRALTIPARYVVGYLEGLNPMDMHAWFEAFIGGRWYTFDPTQENLEGARVVVAYGRDAADVSIYTQFGQYVDLNYMDVQVNRVEDHSLYA